MDRFFGKREPSCSRKYPKPSEDSISLNHAEFRLAGVIPALVTPFTDDSKDVDEDALRRLIRFAVEKGVTGLVPCGTTGECQNLTIEERKRVVEIVVNEARGKVPVIASTGFSSTEMTIELTKHARSAGAQAALGVTP